MSTGSLCWAGYHADPVGAGYPLGNGYRAYLPSSMRFAAPDDWSPFDDGGFNPYAYCGAEPLNRRDPSGHIFLPIGLAIGAAGAVIVKFIGSRVANTFGDRVKDWIGGLSSDTSIGAFKAASTASDEAGSERSGLPAQTPHGPARPRRRVPPPGSREALKLRKTERAVYSQLTRANNNLEQAESHRGEASMLRARARISAEPRADNARAWAERMKGLQQLEAARTLINHAKSVERMIYPELRERLLTASALHDLLKLDFDDIFDIHVPTMDGADFGQ